MIIDAFSYPIQRTMRRRTLRRSLFALTYPLSRRHFVHAMDSVGTRGPGLDQTSFEPYAHGSQRKSVAIVLITGFFTPCPRALT